jgi:hypothetical protein
MDLQIVHESDYANHDKQVDSDLSELLACLAIDVRPDDLLRVEDDEEEDEGEDEETDSGNKSDDSVEATVDSEEAMRCCLQLSSFILQDGSSKEKAMMTTLTDFVRTLSIQRKKQLTMFDFLQET